jgi:hypothetical protein
VTVHHRGGGAPSDDSSTYSDGGYTFGIGATVWEHFRSVWDSYATLNFNGESVDICLSGSRGNTDPAYPVTDADVELIRGAMADARARGYVVDRPDVIPHRNSPGSSTACPGDNTMARWPEIVEACMAGSVAVEPEPEPEVIEMQSVTLTNEDGRPETFTCMPDGSIWHAWRALTGGAWSDWARLAAGPFDSLSGFANDDDGRLELVAHHTQRGYLHVWQTAPNGAWSEWVDL